MELVLYFEDFVQIGSFGIKNPRNTAWDLNTLDWFLWKPCNSSLYKYFQQFLFAKSGFEHHINCSCTFFLTVSNSVKLKYPHMAISLRLLLTHIAREKTEDGSMCENTDYWCLLAAVLFLGWRGWIAIVGGSVTWINAYKSLLCWGLSYRIS